jgi:hypothetical protein
MEMAAAAPGTNVDGATVDEVNVTVSGASGVAASCVEFGLVPTELVADTT